MPSPEIKRQPITAVDHAEFRALMAEQEAAKQRIRAKALRIAEASDLSVGHIIGVDDTDDVYALLYIPAQPLPPPPE